ncbi:MAG TPA: HAD hydrolase-like protein [Candidatus Acidoferrales bacterium]|nr:HAD hydrolase-like protein [Candidatus Acidoferrales bacterium]
MFGRERKPSQSGSRAYWHLLNLMESADRNLHVSELELIESLELQAVSGAAIYEDVVPALSELKAMNIQLFMASSLSHTAISRFLDGYSLRQLFSGAWDRDNSHGIKLGPIQATMASANLKFDRTMFLTDTIEGLKAAGACGVHPIAMMNDPDEGRRLAMHNPAGGIVSLHELPDFIRLLVAENAR